MRRYFGFNGSFVADKGVRLWFGRGVSVRDPGGVLVGPDVPRFAGRRLLCGAPVVTTVAGTTGFNTKLHGAGVASDNTTPVYVVLNNDTGVLTVHVGGLPGTSQLTVNIHAAGKGGNRDILRGSVDEDTSAWIPKAVVVLNGLILVQCAVARSINFVWVEKRMGIVRASVAEMLANPGNPSVWFRRHALTDDVTQTPGTPFVCQSWSMANAWVLDRDGSAPTTAWVPMTDYRNAVWGGKDGGGVYVMRVRRPNATSGAWVCDGLIRLYQWFDTSFASHLHAAGVAREGENGMVVYVARGDSLLNNAVYEFSIDDESAYLDGATEVEAGSSVFQGSPRWVGPVTVDGTVTLSGDPNDTKFHGNQFVGIAPGPDSGSFLVGVDEQHEGVWKFQKRAAGESFLSYDEVYGPYRANKLNGGTDFTTHRNLVFHIHPDKPEALSPAYVAQLNPGQFAAERVSSNRVLYSPDGELWGQCWAHKENEQNMVFLQSGRLWTGSWGSGNRLGVRSIPVPAMTIAKPLAIGPGGVNHLPPPGSMVVSEIGAGVSVTALSSLPPGVEHPPCGGPVFSVVSTAATSAALGSYRIAEGLAGTTERVRLRVWVRIDTPQDGGQRGGTEVRLLLRSRLHSDGSNTKNSAFSRGFLVSGSKRWVPIVIASDVGAWGSQSGPMRLDLRMESDQGTAIPVKMLVAFDSLMTEYFTPYPVPAGVMGPHEEAEIGEFDGSRDWTLLIAGMVPADGWDAAVGQPSGGWPLVSISNATGTKWVQAFADGTARTSSVRYFDGTAYSSAAAATDQSWEAMSPVLLGVTYARSSGTLSVHSSVGGSEVKSGSISGVSLGTDLSRVRLGQGDFAAVTAMEWIAGMFDSRSALSEGACAAELVSLRFVSEALSRNFLLQYRSPGR